MSFSVGILFIFEAILSATIFSSDPLSDSGALTKMWKLSFVA